MAKSDIVSEFARLNGVLGPDSWVQSCVQFYNNGVGDKVALQSQYASKKASAEADILPIIGRIVRDANGNGSINSLSPTDRDALEIANHRLQRVDAAFALLDGSSDSVSHACNCLGNGAGGVKPGCTAKCQAKKVELMGGLAAAVQTEQEIKGVT